MKKRRSFLRRKGTRTRAGSVDEAEQENGHHDEQPNKVKDPGEQEASPSQEAQSAQATKTENDASRQAAEKESPQSIDPQHLMHAYHHYPQHAQSPTTTLRFAVGVNDACEEIWKCTSPRQAASWLELLHHALMRTSQAEHYVPSEVFMCISGTALRFQVSDAHDDTNDVVWLVWEEAMWAAAALARVCVGVAWRHQLKQRNEWIGMIHNVGRTLAEDDSSSVMAASISTTRPNNNGPADEVSTRFFSPMTSLSIHATQRETTAAAISRWYPAIPENLPAAMLRFAAMGTVIPNTNALAQEQQLMWMDRKKSLAEAQRELVLALCFILPEEEAEDTATQHCKLEWTILEAHEPVASMIYFWLESATFSWPVSNSERDKQERNESENLQTEPMPTKDPYLDVTRADVSETYIESKHSAQSSNARSDVSRNSRSTMSGERFWEVAQQNREIDWWAMLRVVRATFDLVSAGWRLPPKDHASEIVAYLLDVVEKGMSLRACDLKSEASECEAREERLAASPSALAALSVLSTIASMGRTPHNMQQAMVRVSCRVQVAAIDDSEDAVSAVFPPCTSDSISAFAEYGQDYETFLDQREDCVSEIASLQWILLAHESSTAAAMAAFLDIIQCVCSNDSDKQELAAASLAVDNVSGSLWGKPPDMPGIASLRIHWLRVLDALTSLSSWTHDRIVQIGNGVHDDETNTVASVHAILSLVAQILVALQRFTVDELIRGECLLAPDEWDLVLELLRENIENWLCIRDSSTFPPLATSDVDSIQIEAGKLLEKIKCFLETCSELETSPLSLALNYESRSKLYTTLLRKAAPFMTPEKGTSLALAVVRCWASTDLVIHRMDEWARTASRMTKEAFAVFEDRDFGFYGGYVHSPVVRREVMICVTQGVESDHALVTSGPFRVSLPLAREQVIALVNDALLPLLMTEFGVLPDEKDQFETLMIPLPKASFSSRLQLFDMKFYGTKLGSASFQVNDLTLRIFATRLVGRLFRSDAVERGHLSIFLDMMRSAASGESMEVVKAMANPSNSKVSEVLSKELPGEFYTSLESIRELEKCLCVPFQALPHAHKCVPPIAETLCTVLTTYGGEPVGDNKELSGMALVMKRLLAISTTLVLARLGRTTEGMLLLHHSCELDVYVPATLCALLKENPLDAPNSGKRQRGKTPSESAAASFINVTADAQGAGSQKSRIRGISVAESGFSFLPIFSSILVTLSSNIESQVKRDGRWTDQITQSEFAIEQLDSNLRAACYDVLGSLVETGITFPFTEEFIQIMNLYIRQGTEVAVFSREDLSRCKCIAAVMEALVAEGESNMESFLQHLLLYCDSAESFRVQCGCRSLLGLLGFVAENTGYAIDVFETVLRRLRLETARIKEEDIVDNDSNAEVFDAAEALLSVLHDLVRTSHVHGVIVDTGTLSHALEAAIQFYRVSHKDRRARRCRLVSVRLVAVLLNNSSAAEPAPSVPCEQISRLVGLDNDGRHLPLDELHGGVASQLKVLVDLATQYVQFFGERKALSTHAKEKSGVVSYHERLAKETDNISRFVVQSTDDNHVEAAAAWICGENALLTCRVGAKKSRYRSWVEIVIRSPTCRMRHLVRLPAENSLEDPEIPSSLWHDPSRKMESSAEAIGLAEMDFDRYAKSSEKLERARLLIEKFDDLMSSDGRSSINTAELNSSVRSATDYNEPKASHPDDSASETSDSKDSIQKWLRRVLKQSEKVQAVLDNLDSLGVPASIMGSSEQAFKRNDILSKLYLPMYRLSNGPKVDRAISILDRTPPLDTHKIALLFATNRGSLEARNERSLEDTILSSTSGPPEFLNFVEGLGNLVLTRHLKYYSAGLDTSGSNLDGKFAVVWLDRDDLFARSMAVFHVVPLMPKGANNRKRHVGNDSVHVVFVDSSCSQSLDLRQGIVDESVTSKVVGGQFGFVIIFVEALTTPALVRISVRLRSGLNQEVQSSLSCLVGDHVASKAAAPRLVRHLALSADVACRTVMEDHFGKTNWEERQAQIAAMKRYTVSPSLALC